MGVGAGSICPTRVVGSGNAADERNLVCAKAAAKHGVPIIADGGINQWRHRQGHCRRCAACDVGQYACGDDESRATSCSTWRRFKEYRAWAASGRCVATAATAMAQARTQREDRTRGRGGARALQGAVARLLFQLVGASVPGWAMPGRDLAELREKARFVRITNAWPDRATPTA